MLAVESKLFIGLATGEIYMYDPFTLELLAKVATCRYATPYAMVLQSAGTLLVGMNTGSLEVFTFAQQSLLAANPVVNEIKVPYAGEIYCMHVSETTREIALATFSGLYIGHFEIGPTGRPHQVWVQNKVMFKDKMISQICELRPGHLLVAEYSKIGYWIVDRTDEEAEMIKIEDTRTDYNSGCVNLIPIPLYDEKWYPYVISRTKFKIDLIDLQDRCVMTLCQDTNSTGMTPKMVVQT